MVGRIEICLESIGIWTKMEESARFLAYKLGRVRAPRENAKRSRGRKGFHP